MAITANLILPRDAPASKKASYRHKVGQITQVRRGVYVDRFGSGGSQSHGKHQMARYCRIVVPGKLGGCISHCRGNGPRRG